MKLGREFYLRSGLEVARDLIGKQLVRRSPEGVTKGIIVETEAYMGPSDPAAHSYKRRTRRTNVQYGPGGFAYVYFIYGMHVCMNIVSNQAEVPEVVLLRALEPVEGMELMAARRKREKLQDLCSGPGKLCQAMGITMDDYGADLCGEEFYVEDIGTPVSGIVEAKRINVDYAGEAADWPWRFLLADSEFVSVPAAPKTKRPAKGRKAGK